MGSKIKGERSITVNVHFVIKTTIIGYKEKKKKRKHENNSKNFS